ncbi:Sterol 3-beta-glucosyltransferase [Apophysomyces sp. BC1015]|nr:Sterol 3-beta-glucosyltransferase [Apophysomyces sp. BC1015]
MSPSLTISDLYDADAQPITIPAIGTTRDAQQNRQPASVTSIVTNALTVPGAIKEFLYLPSVNAKGKATQRSSSTQYTHEQGAITDPSAEDIGDSSSSEEDDQPMVDWLDEKRRSGMKLVYGFLGAGTGNATTTYHDQEENDDTQTIQNQEQGPYTNWDDIDERTKKNFLYGCSLMKTLPCYGKLYISSHHISFNSTGFATKAKVIIPFSDILRIQKIRSKGYIFHALSVLTQKKKEIFLEFASITNRNTCFARLYLHHKRSLERRPIPDHIEQDMEDWEAKLLELARGDSGPSHVIPPLELGLPILSRSAEEPLLFKKPEKSLHFTCITIGTRGDVQPYIALCKGLMKDGHKCRIATHDEFKDWVEEHHIEFRSIGGDPSELMTGWTPSEKLQRFLNSHDKRPIVYIGFGSIIVSNPQEITRIIVEATLQSNVRAIVSKGWSSRLQDKTRDVTTNNGPRSETAQLDDILQMYPETILSLQSVPHDWLFPQMRAVVHHGGAGTTAAGLRAGVPTIVKPFFADQFFWGDRVEEMGLGLCIKKLTVESLSTALRVVSTDENMLSTAKIIGEKIRSENGVETAVQCIYRDMELASERTLSSAQRTLHDRLDDELITTRILDEDQEWTLIDAGASGYVSPDS